jgi:hypothetical protein
MPAVRGAAIVNIEHNALANLSRSCGPVNVGCTIGLRDQQELDDGHEPPYNGTPEGISDERR